MQSFSTIKEFIDALARESRLFTALFDKRNMRLRYDDALLLVDDREDKIGFLEQRSAVIRNGDYLELDPRYVSFFEEILDINAEINPSFIQENIENIRSNINFYLEEHNESRKYNYLRKVKTDLRKTGRIIVRNVVDLGRNIEDAYKTEPTYKIKIAKLQRYDEKTAAILKLTEVIRNLVFEKEQLFFQKAMDEELNRIIHELRTQLNDGVNNLIEIQRQIIDYLNQIARQDNFNRKLQKVKRLKDLFELTSRSNFESVLRAEESVCFETNPSYRLKLSLEELQSESSRESINRIQARMKLGPKSKLPTADPFSDADLNAESEHDVIIDKTEIKNAFLGSGHDLFRFVMDYDYPKKISYGEKVTLYCQIISIYPNELEVSENYELNGDVEYVIVYPK